MAVHRILEVRMRHGLYDLVGVVERDVRYFHERREAYRKRHPGIECMGDFRITVTHVECRQQLRFGKAHSQPLLKLYSRLAKVGSFDAVASGTRTRRRRRRFRLFGDSNRETGAW